MSYREVLEKFMEKPKHNSGLLSILQVKILKLDFNTATDIKIAIDSNLKEKRLALEEQIKEIDIISEMVQNTWQSKVKAR